MAKLIEDMKEIRVERLEDGTIVSRWYECESCSGLGYHDRYYNEFDIVEEPCQNCDGKGEIEVF